jgi:hypothetical protein
METGPYFCKHHGDRLVVAPIALRLCEQCKADALARYAEQAARPRWETDQSGTYDINPRTGGKLRPGR